MLVRPLAICGQSNCIRRRCISRGPAARSPAQRAPRPPRFALRSPHVSTEAPSTKSREVRLAQSLRAAQGFIADNAHRTPDVARSDARSRLDELLQTIAAHATPQRLHAYAAGVAETAARYAHIFTAAGLPADFAERIIQAADAVRGGGPPHRPVQHTLPAGHRGVGRPPRWRAAPSSGSTRRHSARQRDVQHPGCGVGGCEAESDEAIGAGEVRGRGLRITLICGGGRPSLARWKSRLQYGRRGRGDCGAASQDNVAAERVVGPMPETTRHA